MLKKIGIAASVVILLIINGAMSGGCEETITTLSPTTELQSTAGPAAEPTPTVPTPNPTMQPVTVTPSASPNDLSLAGQVRYIANTGGIGVRVRTHCADDSPGAGAWSEGTLVIVEYSQPDCPGWLLVKRSGGELSWVRVQYLSDASPPTVGATSTVTPAAAPALAPTATGRICCKICTKGKACGDTCISRNYTCHKPPGCACNAY